ncbi:hypothetical protein [Clostridium pasteurianum]|uniref:Uncharacterized protein n=1 Tax=Clostridium pasteurianum BC1 TaxID=86416 RepID=R4KGV1_CLOPA|nr:hypothetical protein [Clostridium pasteurianum]AGK98835.1 hypothetical protein Clopa_4096 [Clostridium pasteurianum BC1]
MLKLSALEFFFRGIPESFLCVLLAYIIYNKNIRKILIVEAAVSFAVITYLIRLLPISYGVNTIISMIAFILISMYVMKISMNVSIFSIFVSVILMYFCEWINMLTIDKLFKIYGFTNAYWRFIYNIPSLIMFMILVLIFYLVINKISRRFGR